MTAEQSEVETERQRRICVCIWAYAYENLCASIVPDDKFDMVCLKINTDIATGNPAMDEWFKKHFDPSTGQWVKKHPYPATLRQKAVSILTNLKINYLDDKTNKWVIFESIKKEPEVKMEKAK